MHTVFFFFNDTATTEIYTLSLHDALPICLTAHRGHGLGLDRHVREVELGAATGADRVMELDDLAAGRALAAQDRKSTRLNSSHANISYAVFCLKKKKHYLSHR